MLGTLFITNFHGDVIVEKQFKDKVSRNVLEDFWISQVGSRGIQSVASVVQYTRYAFVHLIVNDLCFLAVNSADHSPLFTLAVLSTVSDTLKSYLKEVTEVAVREHFSVVFQLLEELLDHGFPLTTELHHLEELVPPPGFENKVKAIFENPKKPARGIDLNQVPWRNPATHYSNNEILFDLVESLNITIDSEGQTVRADIHGRLEVLSKLSGMPDVNVHISNVDLMDDISLHKSVRHARFETDRCLSFVPPDGNFTVLQYRLKPSGAGGKIEPPFYVNPQVSYHKDGGRINCMVGLRGGGKSLSDTEKNVHKLLIRIPCHNRSEAVAITACSHGQAAYDARNKQVVWRLGQLPANQTPSLSCDVMFGQPRSEAAQASASSDVNTAAVSETVEVDFQVPNYSFSGIKVSSVNVLGESYKPFKGVKYTFKGGRFEIRTI